MKPNTLTKCPHKEPWSNGYDTRLSTGKWEFNSPWLHFDASWPHQPTVLPWE